MEKNLDKNSVADAVKGRETKKCLKTIMILVVVNVVIAVTGLGIGIYNLVKINSLYDNLVGDEMLDGALDEDEEGYVYGKPGSAKEIAYVYIGYNGNKDFVYLDRDDGNLEHYTFNDDDEAVGDSETVDTTELMQAIYDNAVENLGDNEYEGSHQWYIMVSSDNGDSYVGGTGEAPEWFGRILTKLDVENKGYKSRGL